MPTRRRTRWTWASQLAKSPKKRAGRLTPELRSQLVECRKKGMSARETADLLKIKSHNTVTAYWKRIEEEETAGFKGEIEMEIEMTAERRTSYSR